MSTIPVFLARFSAYHFRAHFEAQRDVTFKSKWYYQPRFSLGAALKNSPKYSHLYGLLFKPHENDNPDQPSSATRLVIRADKPNRYAIKAGEAVDLYITIVANEPALVADFLAFLPEWQQGGFFRDNRIVFKAYQLFNPATDKFERHLPIASAQLTVEFFQRQAPRWEALLAIRFLTPTSIKLDQTLVAEIPYARLMNRISRRLFELYGQYLNAAETDVEPYIFPDTGTLIHAQISLPREPTIKKHRQYDMSGLLGQLFYRVAYDPVAALMLAMAHWIHVGNHTVVGNGQLDAYPAEAPRYQSWLSTLATDRDMPLNESERETLLHALRTDSYVPAAYRRVRIPKSNGEFRELNIPAPLDMFLQKSLARMLFPRLDPLAIPQSFAYRKGKGAVAAIMQVEQWRKKLSKKCAVIRCDIDNFFDSIPINRLLEQLQAVVDDPRVVRMVSLWIKSGIADAKQHYQANTVGIPQGSPLAPLLSNFYLADADRYIHQHITPYFIRYADDLLLLLPPEADPISALQSLTDVLKNRLQLRLNRDFTVSELDDSFSFLGITFGPNGEKSMSREKSDKLQQKIADALYRDTDRFVHLQEAIQGFRNYYKRLLKQVDIDRIDDVAANVYASYIASIQSPTLRKRQTDTLAKIGFLDAEQGGKRLKQQLRAQTAHQQPEAPAKSEREVLDEQRKKLLQKREEVFDLLVAEPGAFVGINSHYIIVKKLGRIICKQPAAQIEQISIISEGVSISSNVSKYAQKKSIRIVFYNGIGEAYASLNGINTILPSVMKAQMELPDKAVRLFIHALVKNKIVNQAKLLRYYRKYYRKDNSLQQTLNGAINALESLENPTIEGDDIAKFQQNAMLHEARCAQIYWQAFGALVRNADHTFEHREHRGATDLVNQMLNYGYAILQSYVMKTIDLWQLNPNIGILHATHDNRPSLCFDLMEQYRAFVVDRSVLAILAKGEKVAQNDKGMLDLDTRSRIISKINERWFATEYYRSGEKLFSDIMKLQTREVRDFCMGKQRRIKFYTPKW